MIPRARIHPLRLSRGWTTAAPSTAPVSKFARPLSASSRLNKAPIAVSADALPGPPPQRWLSDLRARLGKCLVFGCSPAQVTEAGLVLRALADEWRGLLAGSEGFLTGGRRGLEGQQVVWGEQDSFQHVNNVRYIRWAESARVNWVTNFAVRVDPAHGREWAELMTPKAVGLILKSIKTDFKFPMTYPDKVSVYHKLRFPPSEQPSPSSLILDAVIFSHRHRRVAARIEEDIVIYDYRSAKKTEMLPFMRDVLEDTFRLQELEAARARTRIWPLAITSASLFSALVILFKMSIKSTLFLGLAALSAMTEAAPTKRASAGKRGLAFPKQNNGVAGSTYTQLFKDYDQITWMYDWEAVIDGTPVSGLDYVPLLHSNEDWCTSGWSTNVANAQKNYKVTHVLSFNEPDQCGGGGTCMSVSDAVTAHKKYLQPLAGSLKIGSPAVTNGDGADVGINWLKQFVSSCSDCQIDFVTAHWYAWDKAEDFKTYMTNFHTTFNKPVWITEFGVTEGDAPTFLKEILPWMDQQTWIERYAWHMAAPTTSDSTLKYLLNEAGTALNDVGTAFATAS